MRKLGKKQLILQLHQPAVDIPDVLAPFQLERSDDGMELTYTYDTRAERTGIRRLLNALDEAGLTFRDLQTKQSSLEDIFVDLVSEAKP